MGMFDDINYEMNCPYCNNKVNGFQSKDGPCDLLKLEYWQVDRFYSGCRTCGAWIEFYLPIPEREKLDISKYKMVVEPGCPKCKCSMRQVDPLKWKKHDDPEWECTSSKCNPKQITNI